MRQAVRCAAALFTLALLVGRAPAAENKGPVSRHTPIVEAVKKTCTSIVTVKVARPTAKDMVGTGVIVDERGYVVTNRHVVGSAKTLTIRLFDGTDLEGEVVLTDNGADLAVVRVQTSRALPILKPARIDDLMVGETVIAIGHPFGYANTVSTGIISALGREIRMPAGDVLRGLIQTDASINPGNSGGPLLNIHGELIGINVALRDGAQGIAFAINADTVKRILLENFPAQRVAGVAHGLKYHEKILGDSDDSRRVVVVGDGADAGVQTGDEIVAVGGRAIANAFDLERALWDRRPGEQVELKVVRAGQTVTVALTLRPGTESSVARIPTLPRPEANTAYRAAADKNR